MILEEIYNQLQTWIIMLNASDFKDTDAELVRKEMIELASKIWINRNEIKDKKEEIV